MLLHNIPKEQIPVKIYDGLYLYRYGQPCSVCGQKLTEARWTDHDDCALVTIGGPPNFSEFWWCEHTCDTSTLTNQFVTHVYRSDDTGYNQGAHDLGVEYACQYCINGDCPR